MVASYSRIRAAVVRTDRLEQSGYSGIRKATALFLKSEDNPDTSRGMLVPHTELIALAGGQEVFREMLPPGEYVIGRGADARIMLPSEKVSRRHALLTLNYFEWLIEDFQSANGTRVGGQPVKECAQIFPQQEVQVGDIHLVLRRPRIEESADTLSPQALVLLRYLPREMRGQQKYRVKGIIAEGGMGVVLEAEDIATRRSVAMKTLLQVSSPEDTARFIEEAQITAQLEHPNIVPIYEVNVNELDRPFYTMKLVRGESLKQVLQRLELDGICAVEQYPLHELLVIFLKVGDGIAYAHAKGVVHRDLKPENVMLGEFGETMIMDWGLARPMAESVPGGNQEGRARTLITSPRREDPNLNTMDGAALGTPQFMSPEQASGRSHAVDARADVYALGAVLYNILTLVPPVTGASPQEVLERVVKGQITDPADAVTGRKLPHLPGGKLPSELVKTCLKALSLRVEDRHTTVRDLQAEVRGYLAPGGLPGWSGIVRYLGGRKREERP